MVCIFHQNMRNFGGGNGILGRNAAYDAAFLAINPPPPIGPIAVAGFTEITNQRAFHNANTLGYNLCGRLGINFFAHVACGKTALAKGRPEFIGIGVNVLYPVQSVGRIFLQKDGHEMRLIHEYIMPPFPANWFHQVDPLATIDFRGLVYVVIHIGAFDYAIGFIHNRCTADAERILAAGKIPEMAQLMRSNPAIGGVGNVYIGGDFNVLPIQHRGNARTGRCYARSIGIPAPAPGTIIAGGTTKSGNLYDYWYADGLPGLALPLAYVYTNTMARATIPPIRGLSDHAAVALRII